MRTGRRWTAGLVLAVGVAVIAACGGDEKKADGAEAMDTMARLDPALATHLPPGSTMEMAERGRDLFITCSVCHGPDANGTELGPSLRDSVWTNVSRAPDEIERVIREGIPVPKEMNIPMPPMGGGDFDATQLRELTAYVYAISHSASATPPSANSVAADSAAVGS